MGNILVERDGAHCCNNISTATLERSNAGRSIMHNRYKIGETGTFPFLQRLLASSKELVALFLTGLARDVDTGSCMHAFNSSQQKIFF